jgi:hypothetical protein
MPTPFITATGTIYPPNTPALNLSTLSGGSHAAGTRQGYDDSDWAVWNGSDSYGVVKSDGAGQLIWTPVGTTTYGVFTWDMAQTPDLQWDAADSTDPVSSSWTRRETRSVSNSSGTGWGFRWSYLVANKNTQEAHFHVYLDAGTWQLQCTLSDGSLARQDFSFAGGAYRHIKLRYRGRDDLGTLQADLVKTSGAGTYCSVIFSYKVPSIKPPYPHPAF